MAIFKRILFLIMFTFIYIGPAYSIHKVIISLYPIKHIKIFSFLFLTIGLLSFPIGNMINRGGVKPFGIFVEKLGGFFLFYYTYAIIALIIYLIITKIFPTSMDFVTTYKNIILSIFWIFLTILGYTGYQRANTIRISNYKLESDKINESKRIVFFSDLHFGAISTKYLIKDLVKVVNELDADYIMIPGDIIDTDTKVIYHDYIEDFNKLESKHGIYASIGNHEYYGDYDKNIEYIEKLGVIPLLDRGIEVEDFYIVGRLYDYSPRKDIDELLVDNTNNKEVVILDHKPGKVDDLINNNVFLQLSGHTHNGQFFPFNLVTKLLFTPDWGLYTKDNTNIITSCGLGYWAIPIRFPSYSEVVVVEVN